MIRKRITGWFCCWAALAAVGACTDVEFGGRAEHQENAKVQVQVDWSADTAGTAGDLCIAMSRILRSVHYVWAVDEEGGVKVLDSTDFAAPGLVGMTKAADSVESDSAVVTAGLPEVLPGDYYVMAFNRDTALFEVEGLGAFAADAAYSMRDLRLRVREMRQAEIDTLMDNSHADFNPYYTYIKNSGPLFLDVMKQTFTEGGVQPLRLQPEPLTQRLAFRFYVELEEGVEVERIVGEISGVAGETELMSGTVDDSVTCRVLFPAREVSREGQTVLYEGEVNVLGLFPGKDDSFITGPGILQLSIQARSGEYERLFHAGINLKGTITRAGLMNALPGETGFRVAREEAVLTVEALLKIKNNQIEPGGDGQGVEVWFDSDKIDVEV